MEAVAAAMAVMHRSIRGSGRRPLRLTGRAAESPLWSQLLADMTGRPVQALALADGSALGAALLGQLAMDESFDLPGCVESIWATSLNYQPDPRQTAMYQEHRRRLAEGLGQSHQG
jgi:sugar (pentulose or hexulose) kinase